MRDPRKPAPVQPTPWSLSLPEKGWQQWTDGGGSPIHAWMFFIGFVLFPLWWVAGFLVRIPRTREIGAEAEEKGVVLDDPQVEHGTHLALFLNVGDMLTRLQMLYHGGGAVE